MSSLSYVQNILYGHIPDRALRSLKQNWPVTNCHCWFMRQWRPESKRQRKVLALSHHTILQRPNRLLSLKDYKLLLSNKRCSIYHSNTNAFMELIVLIYFLVRNPAQCSFLKKIITLTVTWCVPSGTAKQCLTLSSWKENNQKWKQCSPNTWCQNSNSSLKGSDDSCLHPFNNLLPTCLSTSKCCSSFLSFQWLSSCPLNKVRGLSTEGRAAFIFCRCNHRR